MKNNRMNPGRIGSVLAAMWVLVMTEAGLTGCSTAKPQTPAERVQASADDLRATLEIAVEDADKRQQMQALADQALTELAGLQQEQESLNADYNATRDEFLKLDDRMQTVRRKHIASIIATRQALASLATDDEWKKITSRDLALLSR